MQKESRVWYLQGKVMVKQSLKKKRCHQPGSDAWEEKWGRAIWWRTICWQSCQKTKMTYNPSALGNVKQIQHIKIAGAKDIRARSLAAWYHWKLWTVIRKMLVRLHCRSCIWERKTSDKSVRRLLQWSRWEMIISWIKAVAAGIEGETQIRKGFRRFIWQDLVIE